MPETPELDKMHAVRKESQIIGEFLDAMSAQGYQLRTYGERTFTEPCPGPRDAWGDDIGICGGGTLTERCPMKRKVYERGDTCPRCEGTGTIEVVREDWWGHPGRTIEGILAAHFEIDLTKVDQERESLLDHLRAAQNG